ncbi:MAG: hypothetical protein WDN46_03435 [Methylocella sp.]
MKRYICVTIFALMTSAASAQMVAPDLVPGTITLVDRGHGKYDVTQSLVFAGETHMNVLSVCQMQTSVTIFDTTEEQAKTQFLPKLISNIKDSMDCLQQVKEHLEKIRSERDH